MLRLLPVALIATALLLQAKQPDRVLAGTCASNCPPPPIQFVPGQSINVVVVNQTASLVQFQKIFGSDPIPLRPGQEFQFEQVGGTKPNLSVYFWDETALPLRAVITRPQAKILRIELRPGGRPPGDRSVYVQNDGRVATF